MIVACPSCSTRYRTDTDADGMMASCSRCDASFRMRAARRSYVVLGQGGSIAAPVMAGAGVAAAEAHDPAESAGPWLDFVLALVPSSAGAGIAYYLAGQHQVDPVTWTALGGAAGLLLGWGCLLWIRRAD